ncbi:MAG: UDP-N-acetylmuramoyl-L-alanine--D-glutamate ligase [Alphaproteobacteria bacterium]|nr:UDP-N-acetylmuramoyl-L-alanine--D-glutamate ligase [Alphaproteobacteria bacterium]
MKMDDLAGKKIVIWGTGREGQSVYHLIRRHHPDVSIVFVDENAEATLLSIEERLVTTDISKALNDADVIVKSPGVSLYHPEIVRAKARGAGVTSLMNLWFSLPRIGKTVCITGTKGKSTTAALLAHVLRSLGHGVSLVGNIGQAAGTEENTDAAFFVVEMSSYQAADFESGCDIGVLTSLYPEHLDWHKSLAQYYKDKTRMLHHAQTRIVSAQCKDVLAEQAIDLPPYITANAPEGFHSREGRIYNGAEILPDLQNAYLCRAHNLVNVCTVLTVATALGLEPHAALETMRDFQGLPHRQQELGTKDGILYVDDSISTTPQTTIFALENYKNRPISVIVGGQDRGVDYTPLVRYITEGNVHRIICMGPSGQRIFADLEKNGRANLFTAENMEEAVRLAKDGTPDNGVILLSPAAPSYGMFKNFIERGQAFARVCGF